jgi:putative transposase
MSLSGKRSCIEVNHSDLSIQRQCDLIELPRSSYYRQRNPKIESDENLALMRLIDEEYTKHPFYGTRKMRNYIRRQGFKVNRKRVQRLMRKMGLQSIAPKPNTSKNTPQHRVYPYLLRNMKITCPNQVWCTDITYIPLTGGFVYLTAIMDWHSRYVLSWEVSVCMDSSFCVSALESAFRQHGRPEIVNTDQGSQYTSKDFVSTVLDNDVLLSMDGKGRYIDNIFIERLWRSVKYEEIYTKEYASIDELIRSLKIYFEFYNNERTHAGLEGKTPAEIYFEHLYLQKAA